MGLSNHGWSLKEMLIYCCLLLSCLLVASFFINSLYSVLANPVNNSSSSSSSKGNNTNGQGNSGSKNNGSQKNDGSDTKNDSSNQNKDEIDLAYYKKQEDKLYVATEKYLKDYRYDLSTNILKVELNTLIGLEYIDKIVDSKGSTCTGYSNVLDDNGKPKIYVYIKCGDYMTKGY